jgi:hypothetical protein
LLLVVTGACSSGSTATATSTTRPRSSTTTTSALDSPQDAVVAAYDAAGRAYVEAAAIPDPDLPALAATTVDPLLAQSRKAIRSLKLEGRAGRYPSPSKYRTDVDPSTIQIDGDVAKLEACVVDDGQIIEVSTGRVLDDSLSTVLWQAALRRVDGTWRLAEQRVMSRWEGEAGCAVG